MYIRWQGCLQSEGLSHGDNQYFHPVPEGPLDSTPARWFLRSEQQVLCRISPDRVLFTIRVVFAAVCDLPSFPKAAQDLALTLERMDGGEIEHFGGVAKHRRFTDYVLSLI